MISVKSAEMIELDAPEFSSVNVQVFTPIFLLISAEFGARSENIIVVDTLL